MASASTPKLPGRQVCPLCALDDDDLMSWQLEAPGLWRFTCMNHTPAYSWLTTGTSTVDEKGGEGIAHELGVYDDLLALFTEPGPYLEWGIVEHRYAERRPAAYKDLVERYSHTAFGPTQYSASAFLGLAAGRLAREGHLALRFVDATGYWEYNGKISAFCLAPAAEDASLVTWESYAREHGCDPLDWPALEFRHDSPAKATLVLDEPWTTSHGSQWFTADQLSFRGLCAWNHNERDAVPATRLVVTELGGIQDARACCDECFQSVQRYVGAAM
jgi:hypothetical protein